MKSHKTSKRQLAILDYIRERGTLTVVELAQGLQVSDETIRRDAKVLELNGQILKLHGALALPHMAGEAPFERRMRENAEIKRAIANRACQFVEDGDSLMIDTGTTTSIFCPRVAGEAGSDDCHKFV